MIKFKINKSNNLLQWNTGSYNTYYFNTVEEREENIKELQKLKKDFSTWSADFDKKALQLFQ